jgi:ABC-type glycerol-3-phosphate transport system substrate-binding protein
MQTLGTGENSMALLSTNGTLKSFSQQYPQTAGQLMLIPNPAWPGTTPRHAASTWGYSVYSKQEEAKKLWSWKLVDYITSDPQSSMEKINSLLPRAGWENAPWADMIDDKEMVARVSKTSFPSGTVQHWPELQFPVQRAMSRILFENADIQKTLDEAAAEVNEAIRNKR